MSEDLAQRLRRTDPRLLIAAPELTATLPESLTLLDVLPLAADESLVLALLTDEGTDVYPVPLAVTAYAVRRARPGDGASEAVLDLLGRGPRTWHGFQLRRGGAASDLAGEDPPPVSGASGASEGDVVVGGAALVAWPDRLDLLGEPPVDLVAHLRAGGFSGMPPDLGDVVWAAAGQAAGPVVSACGFQPGAVDASGSLLGLALAHLGGRPVVVEAAGVCAALGELVARLHLALATPSDVIAAPVRPATEDDVAAWRRDALDAVATATVLTEGEPGERLRARTAVLRAAFDHLRDAQGTPVLPVDGDLRLQRFSLLGDAALVHGLGRVVHDRPQPLARDLAELLRSLDHVVLVARQRLTGAGHDVAPTAVSAWRSQTREALLDGYAEMLAAGRRGDLFDATLLLAFEAESECRALTLAARQLPRWQYVPDEGLSGLFPDPAA